MKDNILKKIKYMKTEHVRRAVLKSFYALIAVLVLCRCDNEIQEVPKTNDQLVMSEYIANNSDFSEFNKLILNTGYDALLSIRGPYSLFLPNKILQALR